MYCASALIDLGIVALFAIKLEASLVILGLVMLVDEALFFFINVLIPNKMGWLEKYEVGLFGRCSCKNWPIVKDVFHQALPLAFGSLLAYAEWEVLTIFAVSFLPTVV